MHHLPSVFIAVEACLPQMRRDGIPLLLASRDMTVGVVTRFLPVIHCFGVSSIYFLLGHHCPMLRCLLAIGLVYSSLCIPAFAESEAPMAQSFGAHLILASWWKAADIRNATPTSVTMPMSSMEKCRAEGNKAIRRNKKLSTVFWCIEK